MRFPFDFGLDRRLRSGARGLIVASCMLALSGPAPQAAADDAPEETSSAASDSSPDPSTPSTPSAPADPPAPIHEQALDLLVFRPLGTVRVVGGALLWLPISLIQTFMDVNKMIFELPGPSPLPDEPELVTTFDVFVREPARDAFTRPLGQSLEDI